jgi:hypothetical protein
MNRIIALGHRDPNDEDALLQTLAELCGTDRAISLHEPLSWQSLPDVGLEWLFVDASLLNESVEGKFRNFRNVVVFYSQGNEGRLRPLLEPKEGKHTPLFTYEPYNLTERLLRHKYAHQLVAKQRAWISGITRRKSLPTSHHQPIYSGPIIRSPGLENFLNSLRASITDKFEVLSKSFATTTSSLPIPDRQLLLRAPPSELVDAESSLRAFATDKQSARRGCFLVGKRGTGKSTLAYYVGRSLAHKEEVCCIAVDFTFALDQALLQRLAPLLKVLRPLLAIRTPNISPRRPILFQARTFIENILQSGDYDALPSISPDASAILQSAKDYRAP